MMIIIPATYNVLFFLIFIYLIATKTTIIKYEKRGIF